MNFEFATAHRIIFGPGAACQAGCLAADFGRRPLLVTGRDRRRSESLIALLRERSLIESVFSVPGEPEVGLVEEGIAKARRDGCDMVISLGGGSVLDTGKAVAAMLANEGDLLDYLEVIGHGKTLARPSAPFIAIPTTAGTGAEVTRNAVLGSPKHRVKVSLRSQLILPRIALVDPELTLGLPAALTASTGLDALTQLIEPFVCSRANPMVDSLCREGIVRVARSIRIAFSEPTNKAAREDMSLASLFGGLALANAGLGAVHGFAGPIGGMFPVPHGQVCAALLPHVMEMNLCALRARLPESISVGRYEVVARLLTGNSAATPDQGVDWVRHLVDDLKVPNLGTYGITASHSHEVVEKAAKASSMKANPIELTPEELTHVLEQAL